MRVTTVARKPLIGTVSRNALEWGTGGLNIDGSRVGYVSESDRRDETRGVHVAGPYAGLDSGAFRNKQCKPITVAHSQGRWPANVILIHDSRCVLTGTKNVPGYVINRWTDGAKPFGGGAGHPYESEDRGEDVVETWSCVNGCPVKALDADVGTLKSGQVKPGHMRNNSLSPSHGGYGGGFGDCPLMGYGDTGTVSRFFKQARQEENDNMSDRYKTPQELVDYLTNLIGAPGVPGTYLPDLDDVDWPNVLDCSMTGIVAHGTPTGEQVRELMRVLMPGGHLLLVAPDEEPTGHTGACLVEDAGFEIRDTLLLVEGDVEGRLHYVPKASRSEREAGCHGLPARAGFEAVDREEDSAGVDSPRAGAGRTATTVHNHHPTVKSIGIMERLLVDVSMDDGPVLDPFLGSGTTGIACVGSGHDFIGVDREPEYLAIAEARIRHRDGKKNWTEEPAVIVSEAPSVIVSEEVVGLDDLFGWGKDE